MGNESALPSLLISRSSLLTLLTLPLGQWNTNCYVLIGGGESIIVDPAAEPERILAAVEGTAVKAILLTHGHLDHVQALDAARPWACIRLMRANLASSAISTSAMATF